MKIYDFLVILNYQMQLYYSKNENKLLTLWTISNLKK